MHGKGEFTKIKDSICNITNLRNVLPRPADSND